jgi:hypothetical protein
MVADASPQESPRRAPRRAARRWLLATALLFVLVAGAFTLRERWTSPLLAHAARSWARAALGGELTVARVSGSLWRDLVLEGVSLTGGRGPLREVRDARLELRYSLRGALRGEPELLVRVEGRGFELAAPTEAAGARAELADLRLELELAEVRLRRPGGETLVFDRLQASGRLLPGEARIAAAELAAGPNRVHVRDARLDLSATDELALARGLRGELSARLPEASLLARALALPLRAAELDLACANGCAQVTGRLELEGGRLELARGELVLPADGAWGAMQLDLELAGEFTDVAPLARSLGQDIAGGWRGAIEVSGPLVAPAGRFVGHGEALRVRGASLGTVEVDVTTDGEGVRFESCEIDGPALTAVLRGGLRLAPLAFDDLVFNASADAPALDELLGFPCARAFVHARLSGPFATPSGEFEASAGDAALGRLRLNDVEARGRIVAGTLEVAELHLTSGESTLEASGRVQRAGSGLTAELETLALLWRDSRVDLERGARLSYAPGSLALEDVALTSSGGAGRAEIALQHDPLGTRARLSFERYDAGGLLAPFLPRGLGAGRVHGSVQGALGSQPASEETALALDLALEGWRVGERWPELSALLRGEFDGRELDLARFELASAADEAPRLSGSIRVPCELARPLALAAGPVELRLEAASEDLVRTLARFGLEPGPTRTGPCTLALELAGEWTRLAGRAALAAEEVTLGSEATARSADLVAELELGERFRLVEAVLSAPSGTIRVAGEADCVLDVPRWRTDRFALLDAPLDLEAKLDLADIGWVAGLSSDLRRTAGQLAGTVRIAGTALAPSFHGALELREGELRLSGSATPVRAVAANIALEDDVVRIVELAGEVGGAPVRVQGTLEPFGPFRRFDLEVAGENLLLARDAHLRLRADAALSVRGTPSRLAIGGELALAEARYQTEISPIEELVRAARRDEPAPPGRFTLWPDGFLADAELALHLVGPRTFEYRSNLLEASLRPDLWLRGTGAFPVLEGPAYVERATFELPSGTWKLTSGLLTFRPENVKKPELALTAELRVQRHTVRAVVTGPLGPEAEVTLSSSPPLALDDLRALALTGQLPVGRGEERSTAAMEALAVFLARDALVRWFGGDASDAESLLERFEIDVGAKPSRSGQPTGRVLFYLKPESRRSGRATYLTAEIDEYDRVNYAFGWVFRPR